MKRLRRRRHHLGHGVVVDLQAQHSEGLVWDDVVQRGAAEAHHVGEQHLGVDAAFVHQSQAGLRIEGTLVHPVKAALQRIEKGKLRAVSCDDTSSAGEPDFVAIDDPGCETVTLLHVEHAVLVALRGPAGPEVVGLRVVGVCVNDLEVLSQLCHVMTLSHASNVREPLNVESRAFARCRQSRAGKRVTAWAITTGSGAGR